MIKNPFRRRDLPPEIKILGEKGMLTCSRCGRAGLYSEDGWFNEDWRQYGVVFICDSCMDEMEAADDWRIP